MIEKELKRIGAKRLHVSQTGEEWQAFVHLPHGTLYGCGETIEAAIREAVDRYPLYTDMLPGGLKGDEHE